MAYEIGTATSTFDLMDKLTTFMSSVSGWTLHNSLGDYDKVYRSTGSSGNNAIYIRQRVGEVEPFQRGANQYDFGGGDTGYLNFFAYAHYPSDGDGYAGLSEAGTFGPRIYWTAGNSSYHTFFQEVLTQRPGGSPHIVYGDVDGEQAPGTNTIDTHGQDRRRWSSTTRYPYYPSSLRYQPTTTDAHRNLYVIYVSAGATAFHKFSLARKCGKYNIDGTVDRGEQIGSLSFTPRYITFAEDRATRKQYVYLFGGEGDERTRINLADFSQDSIAAISWPSGVDQDAVNASCWDGGSFIYMLRGNNTTDWAQYDIRSDSWQTNPGGTSIPFSFGHRWGLDFVDKSLSGFTYNRLYLVRNDANVYYINLADETGLPVGGWTLHGDMTSYSSFAENRGKIFANRFGKFIYCSFGSEPQVEGIYERFKSTHYRALFHTSPKETGNLDWKCEDPCYFIVRADSGSTGAYSSSEVIDGYACRVRTSIDSDTDYVFIADEDRVIVATKSNSLRYAGDPDNASEWNVAYMGAFESAYEPEPYGELEEAVDAGFSKKVKLTNTSGTFVEGEKYFIIDTEGGGTLSTHPIWNKTCKYAHSESVVAEKVENNVVTLSLKHNYSAGSKLAIDPQPVGVFFWELEKFQTTNFSNKMFDDRNGSDDLTSQTYTCAIPESPVSTSAGLSIDTNNDLPMWEYKISSAESEAQFVNREVRGNMIGFYAVGKASGMEAGQTVALSDGSYYLIDLPEYNKFVAIGPLA